MKVYDYFDAQYNSKLFAKHLCDDLYLDNEVLLEVIEGLNHSADNSYRYDFSVIESDVLGNIYEQYLGNILKATPKRAKLSESKTHRKEQGIYYTPSYIVDYIVKNTVGDYIKTHTHEEIKNVKILDPACGSGSFLIRAYKELEKYWIKELKLNEGDIRQTRFDLKNSDQFYTLKTDILRNNIFGVDLDPKAVEIAQLNLLLQVSERKHRLPLLQNTIKVGNSLIDDPNVSERAFKWEEEFPEIIKEGGFDIVIGNPPYVRQESLSQNFKKYSQDKFSTHTYTADIYIYFLEQSCTLLSRNGIFGMICSNKFMRANYGKSLRLFLAKNYSKLKIIDFGELPVFEQAATFPAVVIAFKNPESKKEFSYAPIKKLDFIDLEEEVNEAIYHMDERAISGDKWIIANRLELDIIEKIKSVSIPLGKYIDREIYYGIKTGLNKAFLINNDVRKKLIEDDPKSVDLIRPVAIGDSIRKYHIRDDPYYIILIPNGWTNGHSGSNSDKWSWFSEQYPAIANHLAQFEKEAESRYDKGEYWWELRPCDYYAKMEMPKIVFPDIAKESRFAFDTTQKYVMNTAYIIPKSDFYLLGILNSRLVFSFYKRIASVLGDPDKRGRLRWIYQDVINIPIYHIDGTSKSKHRLQEQIENHVREILHLSETLGKMGENRTDQKTNLEQRISELDMKVDYLIYDLYGITDKEKAIIDSEYL